MPTYFVADHVSVCGTAEAAILLDLRADRYHGLNSKQARSLAPLVQGWPGACDDEADEREGEVFAEHLVKLGLLTKDPSLGKSAAPVKMPRVQMRLYEWNGERWPAVRALHWWRLALAFVRTKFSLRFRSMESIVRSAQRRKKAAAVRAERDMEELRKLTAIYCVLRPFFYTQQGCCLLDSMVLVEFMAQHNIFPTWVIGVTATPFGAHSWVQVDHYVLTCAAHVACRYTPILAV